MDLECEKEKGEMAGTKEGKPGEDGSLSWSIPTFSLTAGHLGHVVPLSLPHHGFLSVCLPLVIQP